MSCALGKRQVVVPRRSRSVEEPSPGADLPGRSAPRLPAALRDSLHARILGGELPPRGLLPSESELIHEYGVSVGRFAGPSRGSRPKGWSTCGGVGASSSVGARRATAFRPTASSAPPCRQNAFPGGPRYRRNPGLEVRRHAVVEVERRPRSPTASSSAGYPRCLPKGFDCSRMMSPVQGADFYLPAAWSRHSGRGPASEPMAKGTIARSWKNLGIQVTEIAEDGVPRAPPAGEVETSDWE